MISTHTTLVEKIESGENWLAHKVKSLSYIAPTTNKVKYLWVLLSMIFTVK